jgi:hypothetical protein
MKVTAQVSQEVMASDLESLRSETQVKGVMIGRKTVKEESDTEESDIKYRLNQDRL